MDDTIEKLVNQLKSNDVDARVDAAAKLQAELEAGAEISDSESLVSALKACLKTPNQHLQTATLSALPPLIPLLVSRKANAGVPTLSASTSTSSNASANSSNLIDAYSLRQLLHGFLPPGGIIDRLGDAREKSREKARETLVLLGGYAFRSGAIGNSKSHNGKGSEPPLMIFERFLREGGLSSKVWRVREQSILTLVQIRRNQHLFPIRPYLPLLIASLEDTDANVRECARTSIVELFTGPGVTDAARTDLKKEMTKKNVRKQIADSVLNRVLSGSTSARAGTPFSDTGSEAGDSTAKKAYVPPSMKLAGGETISSGKPSSGPGAMSRTVSQPASLGMSVNSRPASRAAVTAPVTPVAEAPNSNSDIPVVYIASTRDLENEFAGMLPHFEGKENEHNWAARERSIVRLRGMLKGEVHLRYTDALLDNLKSLLDASLKTLASLRTTVAVHTCSLYIELSTALGTAFDPFCEGIYLPLLNMACFTKKITAQQSQAALDTIISVTSPHLRTLIPLLWQFAQDKNIQARNYTAGHVKTYIDTHGARSRQAIEASGGVELLDKCLRRALIDQNVGVRETARATFWAFEAVWQERASAIMHSLEATAQKQLQKACPNPEAAVALVVPPAAPSQQQQRKSSLAAAIAASRAKAKAIANAPPSLMHQATSASHAMRATSPPAKRAASPSLSSKSAGSPVRGPTSPRSPVAAASSPPRQRAISNNTPRSVSASVVPIVHSRSVSGYASPGSPPSPSSSTQRRQSPASAVSSPDRTMRTAMHTALPTSPPGGKTLLVLPKRTPPRVSAASMSASRQSWALGGTDDSLLLATNVAIPEDSESDMDELNEMLLSTPYKGRTMAPPSDPGSQALSFSPRSDGSARPTLFNEHGGRNPSEPIVEDALRARAEQAESAAERLLELVDPEDESAIHSMFPPSLLNGSMARAGIPYTPGAAPMTPLNRNVAILRQASLFQDSPAPLNGYSKPSLMDVLGDQRHETGWWLKRMSLVERGTPLKAVQPKDRIEELQQWISMLEKGEADSQVLQKLALLSMENPVHDLLSPITSSSSFTGPLSPSPFSGISRGLPSLHKDMWSDGKNFERLLGALLKFLDPTKDEAELEYALIVLWELLENQSSLLDGHEADMFSALLHVRYCNKVNVLEATNTIRDALAVHIDPVYGLTTMHASLRTFHAEPPCPPPAVEVKASTYAFGLIALGKFIVRLPVEVLEEELPRLKTTLISALSDTSSLLVRESAAASIIAAQLVLRDESHLFTLLDGLADEKKNLLTYLFDKHGARGGPTSNGVSVAEKLQREMRRLDGRTSTPPRPTAPPVVAL